MKSFIAFASVLACASAGLVGVSPLGYGYAGLPYSTGVVASGPVSSQFQAQDEIGQFSYGYSNPQSSKTESRTADGITRGAYSYVDANGLVQSVQYVSDPVNGFRVAATNLPVAPAAAPVAAAVATPFAAAPFVHHQLPVAPVHYAQLPVAPVDTPEVQLAKIQHFAAHAEAAARSG